MDYAEGGKDDASVLPVQAPSCTTFTTTMLISPGSNCYSTIGTALSYPCWPLLSYILARTDDRDEPASIK